VYLESRAATMLNAGGEIQERNHLAIVELAP
jgi:hypothetical protein